MTTDRNRPETTLGESDLDALGDAESGILSGRLRDAFASVSFGVWEPPVEQTTLAKKPEGHQTQPRRWDFGRLSRKPSAHPKAIPQPAPCAKVDSSPVTTPNTVPSDRENAAPASVPTTTPTTPPAESTTSRPPARRGRRGVERLDAKDLPPVLTVDEVAVLLRVDRKSAYAMIARREIPGVRKVGRTIRVSRDAVVEWMRQGDVVHGRRKP